MSLWRTVLQINIFDGLTLHALSHWSLSSSCYSIYYLRPLLFVESRGRGHKGKTSVPSFALPPSVGLLSALSRVGAAAARTRLAPQYPKVLSSFSPADARGFPKHGVGGASPLFAGP